MCVCVCVCVSVCIMHPRISWKQIAEQKKRIDIWVETCITYNLSNSICTLLYFVCTNSVSVTCTYILPRDYVLYYKYDWFSTFLTIPSNNCTHNIKLYLFFVPPPGKYGIRPFLTWVRTQGRSPHASGKIKKYLRPRRHSPRCQETRQQNFGKAIGELYPQH